MFIIKSPTSVSAGTRLEAEITTQSCVGFEIINDSPLAFNLGLPNGNANYMAPQTTKFFIGPNYRAGTITINPISVLSSVPAGLSSNVIIVGFNEGDDLPSYGATDIGKLVYVAGTVNVPTPPAVKNDGNAPGTQFIEATPSDAASSTVSIGNDGSVTIKGDNAGVLTTLLQLIAGASPAVKLAAAAVLTEALGNMKVDGTLESVGAATMDGTLTVQGASTFNNGVAGDSVAVDATGNVNVGHSNPSGANNVNVNGNVRVNQFLSFFDNGGTARAFATNLGATNDNTIFTNANHGILHIMNSAETQDIATFSDTGGIALLLGTLSFLHGSISRIAFGFSAVTNAGTAIAHNLGAVPDAVFICPSASGITFWVDTGASFTSTSMTVHTSANNNVWWIAIKA